MKLVAITTKQRRDFRIQRFAGPRDETAPVVFCVLPQHGIKFNQVIPITGANGKVIDVTFGWIRNNDGIVRLTTAIPTKK
ncbi:hypothetical protein K5M36_20550 [Chromobacterium vaccinii]|nr:hypothetical protein [Chromobacterium vaccinii]